MQKSTNGTEYETENITKAMGQYQWQECTQTDSPSVYARPILGSGKQTMLTHKVLARHSEGPLWHRVRVSVRVSDWRIFTMAALRYSSPKPLIKYNFKLGKTWSAWFSSLPFSALTIDIVGWVTGRASIL